MGIKFYEGRSIVLLQSQYVTTFVPRCTGYEDIPVETILSPRFFTNIDLENPRLFWSPQAIESRARGVENGFQEKEDLKIKIERGLISSTNEFCLFLLGVHNSILVEEKTGRYKVQNSEDIARYPNSFRSFLESKFLKLNGKPIYVFEEAFYESIQQYFSKSQNKVCAAAYKKTLTENKMLHLIEELFVQGGYADYITKYPHLKDYGEEGTVQAELSNTYGLYKTNVQKFILPLLKKIHQNLT
jgi:hypothetical protein